MSEDLTNGTAAHHSIGQPIADQLRLISQPLCAEMIEIDQATRRHGSRWRTVSSIDARVVGFRVERRMEFSGLAVALIGLAASRAVDQILRGQTPGRDAVADLGAGVVNVLLTQTSTQSAALSRIERQLAAQPRREFEQHI